jgi:hypothetical protein
MKYLKYIALSGLVGISFWACKEDELRPVIHYNGPAVITAPAAGTVIELKEVTAADELPAFTWTAADFGFKAAATYILSLDKAGNNFAEPTTIGSSTGLSLVVTQGDLNTVLLAKGLEGETPTDLELRVIATVNSDAEALVSEGVVVTVIPYTTTIVYPQLQVPGSYQGWDPTNNTTIVYSAKADSKYEGYVYMGEENAKFKYTSGPSWDINWGDDGDDGSLELDGTDIPITTLGTYLLNVNLITLTHTRQLANWGLIGDATPGGWDSDQDMIYDPVANKLTITLDLVPGSIKFRTNDSWDFNYGDTENNKTLDVNGDNIAIAEAGNYTIDMLLFKVTKYKYTITKN